VNASNNWEGQVLSGRYAVDKKLAEGGMATVYLANDLKLNLTVVVKQPLPRLLSGNSEFIDRFRDEVEALAKLQHRHVVTILDSGEYEGTPFLVAQHLGGGTLESKRHFPPVSWALVPRKAELIGWLKQVAAALDFIHSKDFVHRDVKPANILFDRYADAYLGDFGIAKTAAATERGRLATYHTTPGVVIGTPEYVAPEAAVGKPIDGRADQYALGVVAHELLGNRLPFNGPTPFAVMAKHVDELPQRLVEVDPTIDVHISDAVYRALAKEPRDRFPDCTSFIAALDPIAAGVPAARFKHEKQGRDRKPVEGGRLPVRVAAKLARMASRLRRPSSVAVSRGRDSAAWRRTMNRSHRWRDRVRNCIHACIAWWLATVHRVASLRNRPVSPTERPERVARRGQSPTGPVKGRQLPGLTPDENSAVVALALQTGFALCISGFLLGVWLLDFPWAFPCALLGATLGAFAGCAPRFLFTYYGRRARNLDAAKKHASWSAPGDAAQRSDAAPGRFRAMSLQKLVWLPAYALMIGIAAGAFIGALIGLATGKSWAVVLALVVGAIGGAVGALAGWLTGCLVSILALSRRVLTRRRDCSTNGEGKPSVP